MLKLLVTTISGNYKSESTFLYRWFAISLCIHLLVSWFSLGFYHYDEHFQILEFAGYKVGHSPASALPWEFITKIRSAFQPLIVVIILKFLKLFQIDNPFLAATILRVISAILGWISSVYVSIAAMYYLPNNWFRKWFVILSSTLSIIFFIHVRFSSESWSGSLAFLGTAFILLRINKSADYKNRNFSNILFFSGFLFGLSYLCRVQSAFLYPGIFLWLFFMVRLPTIKFIWLIIGILVALLLGVVIDHWFYGIWVNTAFRYFYINIILGAAANFGTEPWWWYIKVLLLDGFWPLQLIMLVLCGIAILTNKKNPFVWISVPFLLVHFLVSHKEMRFLFPLIDALPILIFLGINRIVALPKVWEKVNLQTGKKIISILLIILIIYNSVLIINLCRWPLASYLYPMKYIYLNTPALTDVIINEESLDLTINGRLKLNYYRRPDTRFVKIINLDSMRDYMAVNKRPVLLMLSRRGFDAEKSFPALMPYLTPVYYQYPQWLKMVDINHWTSRTSFWRVYRVDPTLGNQKKNNN